MKSYSRDNKSLRGQINVPSDKSITHRAVLFSSLASGQSLVTCFEPGRDNLASIRVMQDLGVSIRAELSEKILKIAKEEKIQNISLSSDALCRVYIKGSAGALKAPVNELYCGNSGTTARLLSGILAGQNFTSKLSGDSSLSKRPFKRVRIPLEKMGASFSGDFLPLEIKGASKISAITYESPVASAQVKSSILLAGLGSSEEVRVIEPRTSRDHTERMFSAMGVELSEKKLKDGRWEVLMSSNSKLHASDTIVPGDFSSAAFFIVAALITPDSEVKITNVGFNKTRYGLFKVLERMGADISIENKRLVSGEEVVDLLVKTSELVGVKVSEEEVLLAIDEIPILTIAASFAKGKTEIRGAAELRVKESDRLSMMAELLSAHGVSLKEYEDGIDIEGSSDLSLPNISTPSWQHCGDHRIVMSSAILSYAISGTFIIEDLCEIETSFPNFIECFKELEPH